MPTSTLSELHAVAEAFEIALEQTDAGSTRIRFRPAPSRRSLAGEERRLAVLIYELAAEMERRSADMDARWVISPEPFNARLDVEIDERGDPEAAAEFVVQVLSDLQLI
jgi:hypothetical protein